MAVTNAEDGLEENQHRPFFCPRAIQPAIVDPSHLNTQIPFLQRPFFAPILFVNASSDCRDHCANERTFLSWLRLATYLAVVAVAIVISFHLKHQPTPIEQRLSLPLGLVFWLMSLACLSSGLANYVRTVTRYSRRQALVQSGWKTQLVFTVLSTSIIAACILFLTFDARSSG